MGANRGGWRGWWSVAGGRVAGKTEVTAGRRGPDHLDLLTIGLDNHVYFAGWEPEFTDGFHGWWRVGDLSV